jgi:hypothetical protein
LARLGVSQGTIQGFKDVTAALLEFQSQYEDSWKEMTDAATAAQEAADAKAEASFKARIARIEQLWDALGGAREPNVAVGGLSGQALADSVAQRRAARAPLQAVPLPGAFGTGNTANEIAFRKLTAAREQETAAALKQIQATKEARLEALRFAATLGLLPAGLGAAAYALVEMIAKVQELKLAGEKTGKAVATAVAVIVGSLAASLITGKSVTASVARGAIGGAAAGATVGAAFGGIGAVPGAIIGGVAGAIGGFLSGNKAKKEAEAQRKRDLQQFKDSQVAFVEQGKAGGRSPLEQQLKDLAAQFKALEAEAKRLKQSTRELQVSYAQQRAALREAFAEEQRQYQVSIEVRRLAAEGLSVEASALALSVQQQQELTAAQKAGYDAATIAALQYVQALEAEAAAKAATITAMRQAADAADFEAGLTLRETALKGDAAATEIARLNAEAEAAKRRAAILLATEDITQEQFDRLIAVIGGELVLALDAAAKAAADSAAAILAAAEQMAKAERAALQDLDVRFLEAIGQEGAAADLRFQLQQERERAAAVEGKASDALLTKLDEVLAAEKKRYEQRKTGAFSGERDLPGDLAGGGGGGDKGMVTSVERTAFATMEAAGYLASMNIYLREISFHTAVLRSGSTAPASFAGGFNYGGGGTVPSAIAGTGSITLQFTIPADALNNPTVIGQIVLDGLDTALGQRASIRTSASGAVKTI